MKGNNVFPDGYMLNELLAIHVRHKDITRKSFIIFMHVWMLITIWNVYEHITMVIISGYPILQAQFSSLNHHAFNIIYFSSPSIDRSFS